MKILALEHEHPDTTSADFAPHLTDEARAVYELQQRGILREIHFRADRPEAVLFLECESGEAAREILNTLPLVRAGLIDFEVIPLVPYPGLARLFTSLPTRT